MSERNSVSSIVIVVATAVLSLIFISSLITFGQRAAAESAPAPIDPLTNGIPIHTGPTFDLTIQTIFGPQICTA